MFAIREERSKVTYSDFLKAIAKVGVEHRHKQNLKELTDGAMFA